LGACSKRGCVATLGAPTDERLLAERCAFEHEVRRYLTRVQERGSAYQIHFPGMPSLWVDFVNQNKAAERGIAHLNVRRAYEAGRTDAGEAIAENWAPAPNPSAPVRSEAFDPIAMIDRLVQDAVACVWLTFPGQLGPVGADVRHNRNGWL
jgi:hypothetical protein